MPAAPGRIVAHCFAAACALGLLAACAGTGSGSGSAELKTASDQTAVEKRANIRLQLAVGYYQQGKYDIALDEIKQAIAADPSYADAYGMRALIYTAMGQVPLADDNYRHALRLAPNNPELANNYGSFLCQTANRPARGNAPVRGGAEEPDLPDAGERARERGRVQPEDRTISMRPSATCSTHCAITPNCRPSLAAWRGSISSGATTSAPVFSLTA